MGGRLIDWLADWLIDWVPDRLTDCLIDCLTGWRTAWLVDWLLNSMAHWLADWSMNWLTNWLTNGVCAELFTGADELSSRELHTGPSHESCSWNGSVRKLPVIKSSPCGALDQLVSSRAHVRSSAHELIWGAQLMSKVRSSAHELLSGAPHVSSWAELLTRAHELTNWSGAPHVSSWADQLIRSLRTDPPEVFRKICKICYFGCQTSMYVTFREFWYQNH